MIWVDNLPQEVSFPFQQTQKIIFPHSKNDNYHNLLSKKKAAMGATTREDPRELKLVAGFLYKSWDGTMLQQEIQMVVQSEVP